MDVEKMVSAYIQMRDLKEKREDAHKTAMKPLKEAMEALEGQIQGLLLDANVDSMKTAVGTAYLSTLGSATVKDWTQTLAFIVEQQDWSMLEARVSKTAIQDYIAEHGEAPPGVEYRSIQQVRVRR